MLRAKGSWDLRADASSRSKRKSSSKWPSSPKVGTRREKKGKEPGGWKVECDSSIDPEAARSKMASQEKEVGGGGKGRVRRNGEEGREPGRLAVVSQSVKLTVDY